MAELRTEIVRALGPQVLALYLFGSLVVGDFDQDLSDIDLLAVTRTELSETEIAQLASMHQAFESSRPYWRNRIETAYVSQSDLLNFRSVRPAFPVVSPGEPFHLREEPLADWAEAWYFIRDASVPLIGDLAAEVLPDVSRAECIEAIRGYLHVLVDRAAGDIKPGVESYVVLTACRTLHFAEIGTQISKQGGGRWLAVAYPEWSGLVSLALEWRAAPQGTVRPAQPGTFELLRFVLERLG